MPQCLERRHYYLPRKTYVKVCIRFPFTTAEIYFLTNTLQPVEKRNGVAVAPILANGNKDFLSAIVRK